MTMHRFRVSAVSACDASRTASLAAAIALNLFAAMLLARPAELPITVAQPVAIGIRWIETEPQTVALPLPPEPVPPRVVRRGAGPAPESVVDATPGSPPSVPMTGSAADADEAPDIAPTSAVTADANGAAHATLAYTHVVTPRYPRDALRRAEHGTVVLRVHVGRDGLPKRIEIARSSGSPSLDRAALDAVRQWRFRALQIDGEAVPASGLVPVAFNLDQG